MKKLVLVGLFLSSSVALSYGQDKVFTLEELSKFDGQNGNPSYVAVDGVVYDASQAGMGWGNGSHAYGKVKAGTDASEIIKQSPHGHSKLAQLKKVGRLAQ